MLARREHPDAVAKERLKLMVESEPVECTPETMAQMKKEISQVITKYFDISTDQYEIRVLLKQTKKRA